MNNCENEVKSKRKCNVLDSTANDFEDDEFAFRLPKKNKVDTCSNSTKSKGRPKKACSISNSQRLSKLSKNKTNKGSKSLSSSTKNLEDDDVIPLDEDDIIIDESSKNHSSQSTDDFLQSSVAVSDEDKEEKLEDLSDLEKSICSNNEKLCPSCKHIVMVEEFSNHLSACMQKYKYDRENKNYSNKTKELKILPCPVCLKSFSSENERRLHMKVCALNHGLSTSQLISATRLQEKQEAERLALGLPSPRISLGENGTKQRKLGTKSGGGGSRSKSSPDLELACAISRSLIEEEQRKREKEEDQLLSLGLHDVIQEKRRQLVLPQPPPIPSRGKGSRGGRGKKKVLPQTVLMTRTKEERERIITEKVAALLIAETNPRAPPEKLRRQRSETGPLKQYEDKNSYLWNFASSGTDLDLEFHYVSELSEYVKPQNIAVGALLKSLSQIPGRLDYTALAEDSDEEKSEDEDAVETTVVDHYCTQLALAELLCTQDLNEFSLDIDPSIPDKLCEDADKLNKEDKTEAKSPEVCPNGNPEITSSRGNDYTDAGVVHNEGICNEAEEIQVVDLTSEDNASESSQNRKSTNVLTEKDMSNTDEEREVSHNLPQCYKDDYDESEVNHNKDSVKTDNNVPSVLDDSHSESGNYGFQSSNRMENENNNVEIPHTHPPKLGNESPQCKDESSVIENADNNLVSGDVAKLRASSSTSYSGKENFLSSLKEPPKEPVTLSHHNLVVNTSPLFEKFIYDWSCLLASEDKSDVTIITADGEIPVHTLVLAVRCPNILSEIEDSLSPQSNNSKDPSEKGERYINWNNVTYESAYSFMVYLYSSTCTLKSKKDALWMGLYDLAIKYTCNELMEHLEVIYEKSSDKSDDTIVYEHSEPILDNSVITTPISSKMNKSYEDLSENDKTLTPKTKPLTGDDSVSLRKSLQSPLHSDGENINHVNNNECAPCSAEENLNGQNSEEVICLGPGNYDSSQKPNVISRKLHLLSGHSTSPDIFGEWDDKNMKDLMENPSVTPPGSNMSESLLQNVHSPELLLNAEVDKKLSDSKENYGTNTTHSKPQSSDHDVKTAKVSLCRNLSKNFEHYGSSNDESQSDAIPESNLCNMSSHSLPDFHNSLSDIEYPSANEFVDLTVCSENSLDAPEDGKTSDCDFKKSTSLKSPSVNDKANMDDENDKELSYFKSKFTLSKVSNEDSHSPNVNFGVSSENEDNPMSEKPNALDSERREPSMSPNFPRIVSLLSSPLLKEHSSGKERQDHEFTRGTIFKEPNKRDLYIGDKENLNKGPNDVLFRSQPNKVTKLSVKSTSELQPSESSFNSISDQSLLKAFNNYESESTSKKTKLFKSKSCSSVSPDAFVTPVKRKVDNPISRVKKFNVVTPMPDYSSMVTPELNKELDKYGIRKLSRKKAVKLLLHIYEQLHPLVTDSEAETPIPKSKISKCGGIGEKGKKNVKKKEVKESVLKESDEGTPSEDVLNSSQNSSTSNESGFECLEETAFPNPDEEEDEGDAITASQMSNLETRLATFIRSDTELHAKVLRYEPVWANELLQDLKVNGIKCSMAKLIDFLDEQCITFRLPTRDRTRTKKGRKKTSPKKKSPRKKTAPK